MVIRYLQPDERANNIAVAVAVVAVIVVILLLLLLLSYLDYT
jgi:hypothetical protein